MTQQAEPAVLAAPSVIIYGPQGCGKSRHAQALASYYGLTAVIHEWSGDTPLPSGALILTNNPDATGAVSFADAMAAAGLSIPANAAPLGSTTADGWTDSAKEKHAYTELVIAGFLPTSSYAQPQPTAPQQLASPTAPSEARQDEQAPATEIAPSELTAPAPVSAPVAQGSVPAHIPDSGLSVDHQTSLPPVSEKVVILPQSTSALSATAIAALPSLIGATFAGGLYAGRIVIGADTYALIVSPAEHGRLKGCWNDSRVRITGAESRADGLANTQAMAAAGSTLAAQALALSINGFSDWYLPARDELELLYRHFKPTADENYADGDDGINPSSVPAGLDYSEETPGQTALVEFQDSGAEALADGWYWSSTQYAAGPSSAWGQVFIDGFQDDNLKSNGGRARAVRRLKI